jgi:hypothetical protein
MRTRTPLLVTALLAVSGCAHECPRKGPPEVSWAEQLACHDHAELDDRPPTDRAGEASDPSHDDQAEGVAVARYFLNDRPGGAWKAGGYEWLTAGRMYWVMGPFPEPYLLVAVLDARSPILLTGDLAATKRFLRLQFNGRLRGVDALNGIAQLVKDVAVGPGGSIATPEFFKSQKKHLGAWLRGRERDPAQFEKMCSGIHGSLEKNEWTLEFNVINGWGGVDVVRASGTASPLTLRDVSVAVVKARGEFYYPLEG